MINPSEYWVAACRRAKNEAWTFQQYFTAEEMVEFKSVGVSVAMTDLYENVSFEPKEEI